MIHHWKGLELEITKFENHHEGTISDETIPYQTSNIKHVKIIKVSDKPTYDTPSERS